MKARKILGATATMATGFAIGYLLVASRNHGNNGKDVFRYTDENALRRAQAGGMAKDYREMEMSHALQ